MGSIPSRPIHLTESEGLGQMLHPDTEISPQLVRDHHAELEQDWGPPLSLPAQS